MPLRLPEMDATNERHGYPPLEGGVGARARAGVG
jgi:hypothetical protein